MKHLFILLVALITLVSCTDSKAPDHKFIEITGIDPSVRPGENFYR